MTTAPDTEPEIVYTDDLTPGRVAELAAMIEPDPEDPDTWVYTGPLDEGRVLAARYGHFSESKTPQGLTVVIIGDVEQPTWDDRMSFGRHLDPERAWRYALGAEFATVDADA